MTPIIILIIILALVFDFLNGIHDSSNIVATMIASRAYSPRTALGMTAVANFLGPFIFGVAVAETIGNEVVDSDRDQSAGHFDCIIKCHFMESDHLVSWVSEQLIACPGGRLDRCGPRRSWMGGHFTTRITKGSAHPAAFSSHWLCIWIPFPENIVTSQLECHP